LIFQYSTQAGADYFEIAGKFLPLSGRLANVINNGKAAKKLEKERLMGF